MRDYAVTLYPAGNDYGVTIRCTTDIVQEYRTTFPADSTVATIKDQIITKIREFAVRERPVAPRSYVPPTAPTPPELTWAQKLEKDIAGMCSAHTSRYTANTSNPNELVVTISSDPVRTLRCTYRVQVDRYTKRFYQLQCDSSPTKEYEEVLRMSWLDDIASYIKTGAPRPAQSIYIDQRPPDSNARYWGGQLSDPTIATLARFMDLTEAW
jgi:hypothetical protein